MAEELVAIQANASKAGGSRQDPAGGPTRPAGGSVPRGDAAGGSEAQRALVRQAVEEANSVLRARNISLQFSVDESAREIVVKVTDKESGDLIRQIPPEENLRIAAHLRELLGLLVSETA